MTVQGYTSMKLNKKSLDGNVETLLLSVLEEGPSYGYAIVQELNSRAEGLLKLGEGTIYPVLHRLEDRQLITSNWPKMLASASTIVSPPRASWRWPRIASSGRCS
jgi:hypothetical protein